MKRMTYVSILLSIAALPLFAQKKDTITVTPSSIQPYNTTVSNNDILYIINSSDTTLYLIPRSADTTKWNKSLGRGTKSPTITIGAKSSKSYTISHKGPNDTLQFTVNESSNPKRRIGDNPKVIVVGDATEGRKKSQKK